MADAPLAGESAGSYGLPNCLWPIGDASRDTRLADKTMLAQNKQSNSEGLVVGDRRLGAVLRFLTASGLRPAFYAHC